MAFSDSEEYKEYRRKNRSAREEYREYLEDEEDYEEYARARDRENTGRSGKRAAGPAGRAGSGSQRGGAVRTGRPVSRETGRPQAAGNGRQQRTGSRENRQGSVGTWDGSRENRQVSADPRDGSRGNRQGFVDPREANPAGKRRRKKRGILGILLRLFVIVLLLLVIVGGILFYKVRDVLEMQRVNSVDLEEQLLPGISSKVKNDELMQGYLNIALFGVDSRSGDLLEGDNRSDSIMICSIHEKTGQIKLVSVYRDTMLEVGDGYYTKANTANALGGPAQAITMLNRNLDLNILDFVTVGFEGLAHTIDALGGIELEIDEEEREYLNQYVHDMHVELGTEDTPVEETGLVRVTGIQATAYSRIRYTAGDDFRRAERQRTVLEKTLEKAKEASPATLVEVANSVVGDMATSLSSGEIVGLILKAQSLELAGTGGLPQEDYRGFGNTWEDGDYVLPLTLADNVRWLHAFLFGEEDYILSEEAAMRSDYIGMYY